MTRYHELAAEFSSRIHEGVLRPGDRLPAVRKVSRARRISPATVIQAYRLLEDRGEITTRARSGHYVRADLGRLLPEPVISRPSASPGAVNVSDLLFDLLQIHQRHDALRLGAEFPGPELFPMRKLARALQTAARLSDPYTIYEQMPPGNPDLRRLIARSYMESGSDVQMEEIVVTSGALEALNLCLQAVTRPGDLVAIESPTFYAALEAIERLGLKAVEIPTDCRDGISVSALSEALDSHPIKACWIMPNFQNPLGALMPDAKKRELVNLLAKRGVPLIEDDTYAELYFGPTRPIPAKAYDRAGLVLHCSSFSKCLAPGYRVGWAAPGRFFDRIYRAKLTTTIATSGPAQMAIAEFLKHGGYNNHLRRLRRKLEIQQGRMLEAIRRNFPTGTRASKPTGGYYVWVEMAQAVNAMDLYRLGKEKNISISPGPMFSPRRKFANCVRLNYGRLWSPRVESAIATLGSIAKSLA